MRPWPPTGCCVRPEELRKQCLGGAGSVHPVSPLFSVSAQPLVLAGVIMDFLNIRGFPESWRRGFSPGEGDRWATLPSPFLREPGVQRSPTLHSAGSPRLTPHTRAGPGAWTLKVRTVWPLKVGDGVDAVVRVALGLLACPLDLPPRLRTSGPGARAPGVRQLPLPGHHGCGAVPGAVSRGARTTGSPEGVLGRATPWGHADSFSGHPGPL